MKPSRIWLRIQTFQYCRSVIILALCMLFILAIMGPGFNTTVVSYRYQSWQNVSVFHLVKMHLAGRPSHVISLSQSDCSTLSSPMVNKTMLNYNQIQFHDDVVDKMATLNASHQWKKTFYPLLNRTAKMSLLHLYAVFKQALDNEGLPHVLMHGSAMGAWRHHGLTPWDDDIDIGIDVADWFKLRRTLSCIDGYSLDASTNSKWAFYKSDSPLINTGPKRYPFLDLFLYTSDDNYVWALNYVHLRKFLFPKEHMFPVQYVPFECFLVPVPRHLRKVLEHQYVHPEICTSHYADHSTGETGKVQISRPCSELADMYKIYDSYN